MIRTKVNKDDDTLCVCTFLPMILLAISLGISAMVINGNYRKNHNIAESVNTWLDYAVYQTITPNSNTLINLGGLVALYLLPIFVGLNLKAAKFDVEIPYFACWPGIVIIFVYEIVAFIVANFFISPGLFIGFLRSFEWSKKSLCPNCKVKIAKNASFCSACGKNIAGKFLIGQRVKGIFCGNVVFGLIIKIEIDPVTHREYYLVELDGKGGVIRREKQELAFQA